MKKRFQIIALLLVLPLWSFSQKKLSIGVNTNAMVSFMRVTTQFPDKAMENGELGFGYSFGFHFHYLIYEEAFLRTGLDYQKRNSRYKYDGPVYNGNSFLVPDGILQFDFDLSSIGIPIEFGYKLKSKKEQINYIVGFGTVLNLKLKTKTKVVLVQGQTDSGFISFGRMQADESLVTVGIFGGIEIVMNKKLRLTIEPNIRFTPNDFDLGLYESDAWTSMEAGLTLRVR